MCTLTLLWHFLKGMEPKNVCALQDEEKKCKRGIWGTFLVYLEKSSPNIFLLHCIFQFDANQIDFMYEVYTLYGTFKPQYPQIYSCM